MATEKTKLLSSAEKLSPREVEIQPDELADLLKETNFTQREIEHIYKYSKDEDMSRKEFVHLCAENGITAKGLAKRMWNFFDSDSSGGISKFELVKGLNPLLRGTKEQVAAMFFDLYEVDGDGELSAAEIISVYSDLILLNDEERKTGLTSAQKRRITEWVQRQQNLNEGNGGRLDKETFVAAVLKMEEDVGDKKQSLFSCRSLYFIFLTAWFEVGTSFSLPAMGALAGRIKERMDIGDEEIGQLTAAYFCAAMIGPLIGGIFMDKYGPSTVIIVANIIVTVGSCLQAKANGPGMYGVMMLGRLLIGFGGEMTPFCTLELLGRIFPDYFGLMAGICLVALNDIVGYANYIELTHEQHLFAAKLQLPLFPTGIRNLIQSLSSFLAFILLPLWAENASTYPLDTIGTGFSLWMCALLGAVSTLACIIVKISVVHEQAFTEERSDQATIIKTIHAFSKATTPQIPDRWSKYKLPSSFFFAAIGIQAQYFAPFAFTAFSIKVYVNKFGLSSARASFFTGLISLIAGILGPVFGPLSDAYGRRSLSLMLFTGLSVVGFVVLAVSSGGSTPVWIASILFAIQYGFGDTVAYCSIRLITGVSRAGVGYGLQGIIGNFLSTIVPIVGGSLLEQEGGNELVCWYFAAWMLCGSLCWLVVLGLEGARSLLELPANDVIETSDEDLHLASLSQVIGSKERKESSLLRRRK